MPTTLRTVSVVDAVAEALRRAILSGRVEPGGRLTEAALSERYDVPRQTVRSALQTLVIEGLLVREPNRSVYVPQLTLDDIDDLFAVRTMVEEEATGRLVDRAVEPTAAWHALRVLEALPADADWDVVTSLDFELHQAVVDAVGSPRLSKIYAGIAAEVRLAIAQLLLGGDDSPSVRAREHRLVLEAIASGDRATALARVREHLADARRTLAARSAAGPDAN